MKVLITGGAGFIGSHLAERCVEKGYQVRVLDNLSTGRLQNLSFLKSHPSFEFLNASVLDKKSLINALEGCEVVFHLAAIVGVQKLMQAPEETYSGNLQTANEVFEQALKRGITVVFASSSEVYGNSPHSPSREEDAERFPLPDRPRFLYGKSKLDAEKQLQALTQQYCGRARALRFFNVIGRRQVGHYGMVVPRFLEQALREIPITVYGDGTQSRCFADVEEVAEALIELVPSQEGFDALNLGSRNSVNILELAEQIRKFIGSPSRIVHVSPQEIYGEGFEDFHARFPDLSKIEALGFKAPSNSIEQILQKILRSHPAPAIASSL